MPPLTNTTIDAAIRAALEDMELRQIRRQQEHMEQIRALITSAFPDGDAEGHRRYHEAQIAYMTERAALWREIRSKTTAGLVWMGLLALGTAVWEYVRAAVLRGAGGH